VAVKLVFPSCLGLCEINTPQEQLLGLLVAPLAFQLLNILNSIGVVIVRILVTTVEIGTTFLTLGLNPSMYIVSTGVFLFSEDYLQELPEH
jgi:hypothetical protein